MKKIGFLFISIFVILAQSKIAFAQIGSTQLTQKLPVLNGRAFLRLPANATNVVWAASIMSTNPNKNQETRFVLDFDKMRLIFYAQELYKISNGDFYSEVIADKSLINSKKQVLENGQGFLSVLCSPLVIDTAQRSIVLNTLLVKTKDNTVFRIDAYINPPALKEKNEFIALSKKVFESLQNGTRLTNRNARNETVKIFGTKRSFQLFIPKDYAVTVDAKYDFQVIRYHKYVDYRDTSLIDFIIYTGYHPWVDYERYGFEETSSKNIDGIFLNDKISWMTFYDPQKNIFLKEQKIPSDRIAEGLIVHIGIAANKKEVIEEQTKIVEAIRLK